jgi:L-ribulose-5-phosphate 3-epimerase
MTGAAVAASLGLPETLRAAPSKAEAFPIAGFEKHFFEKYSPAETAQTFDEIGVDLELTLRPEGHVRPERAADDLPPLVEALARRKRRILVLATSFLRPDEPDLERALRTARSLGITQYRHRGYRYDATTPLKKQLAGFRSQMKDFAAMNRALGLQGLFQNHAGAAYVGSAIWDLDLMLDDIAPAEFAVAFDTRHLLVEQGRSWPTAARLIAPRIGALYLKSFRWDRDRTIETPLGDGNVNQAMIKQIVGDRPSLPVCIHVEYPKLAAVPFAERAATVELFRRDAAVARTWLGLT